MNLREWLNYHKNCPLCQSPLTTYLHSSRRQSIRWEEDRMIVVYPLPSKKNKISGDYNVGYSFSLSENQFCIEFYNKDSSIRIEHSPYHLMDKFKALNDNLKNYRFYRFCNNCHRYHYTSGMFKLDLRDSVLKFRDILFTSSDFFVSSEYFGLIQAMEKGSKTPYRIYRLLNVYSIDVAEGGNGSHLTYWNSSDPNGMFHDQTIPNEANYLDLPLISFVSPEETLSRIQKLLVFS